MPARTELLIGQVDPADSFESLTDLLHLAYARLANMGFRYLATHQDVETTRRRAAKGECYLGIVDARIVGTILFGPPGRPSPHCGWYNRPEVATVSQFGVLPELQGLGFGSAMMNFCEARARLLGAAEIALDTAEGAAHLISFYEKRGYRLVGHEQWDHTNYRSVVLSKSLSSQ